MPTSVPNDLAWSHDPTLGDDERWRAFKVWEAAQRQNYNESSRAQEDYAAWLASDAKPVLGKVRRPASSRRKVHHIS